MLRFFGSVSNLSLLIIGDYYYYSHDKMVKGNGDQAGIWPTGHSLVTLFSLSVSIKDRPLHWILVRSQTYYPGHILAYGS